MTVELTWMLLAPAITAAVGLVFVGFIGGAWWHAAQLRRTSGEIASRWSSHRRPGSTWGDHSRRQILPTPPSREEMTQP